MKHYKAHHKKKTEEEKQETHISGITVNMDEFPTKDKQELVNEILQGHSFTLDVFDFQTTGQYTLTTLRGGRATLM